MRDTDFARLAHWHRLSADAADRQMTRAGRTAWSRADRALADYVLALLTEPHDATKPPPTRR